MIWEGRVTPQGPGRGRLDHEEAGPPAPQILLPEVEGRAFRGIMACNSGTKVMEVRRQITSFL